MLPKPVFALPPALAAFLTTLGLLRSPQLAQTGCECGKPLPAPAAVIPNVAFWDMLRPSFLTASKPGRPGTCSLRAVRPR